MTSHPYIPVICIQPVSLILQNTALIYPIPISIYIASHTHHPHPNPRCTPSPSPSLIHTTPPSFSDRYLCDRRTTHPQTPLHVYSETAGRVPTSHEPRTRVLAIPRDLAREVVHAWRCATRGCGTTSGVGAGIDGEGLWDAGL